MSRSDISQISATNAPSLEQVSGIAPQEHESLLAGEVLLHTRSHTMLGAGVTTQMYLPILRSHAWQQLSNYPRWVKYFPDITQSKVLGSIKNAARQEYRLHQTARKMVLLLSVQVEIYLRVIETVQQRIQFRLERGSFHDFAADLTLHDYSQGTLLTYSVEATPLIPVPSPLIQEAIRYDLPGNMRQMRQVLCS